MSICTATEQTGNRRGLVTGIAVLTLSLTLALVCMDMDSARNSCTYPRGNTLPPGEEGFLPGSTFTITCTVSRDIGQDLTFWAHSTASGNGPTEAIPANVEIRDPNNKVIFDQDYSDGDIVIYITPEIHGTYSATITSMEDPDDRAGGIPEIHFAFGYLVPLITTEGYNIVYNPVGTLIHLMSFLGLAAAFLGVIMTGFGIDKILEKKENFG